MQYERMVDRSDKMDRPRHLPDFEAPPLTEVAVSLQFQQIANFGFVDIGPLWECFRDRFSRVEYHLPLAPTFETFGLPQGTRQPFLMNFGVLPPLPRCWFINAPGTEVLQFQTDRFVSNWRKVEVDNVYPRYEHIRARFAAELDTLNAFLTERGFGPLVPNQCEITYINVISVPDGVGERTSRVFKNWSPTADRHLGEAEDVAFTCRFRISDELGEPIGRLIAQTSPASDAEGRPVIQLMMIGRGRPPSPTLEAAFDFFDIARDRIVCGFAELTTDEMHKIWKLRS
jgi:uncharacterized protein (TIGR04255 family)